MRQHSSLGQAVQAVNHNDISSRLNHNTSTTVYLILPTNYSATQNTVQMVFDLTSSSYVCTAMNNYTLPVKLCDANNCIIC